MIPLTVPELGDEEVDAAAQVYRSGMLVQGEQVAAFEGALSQRTGRSHAVAVSSGSAALELALRAVGAGPGDRVLCPALTWPSPAHAVRAVGAEVVLVDVDPEEWNAAPEAFAQARCDRTLAAIAIDQFGFPARHTEIEQALEGLSVIVDAACSLGSLYEGAPGGSHGVVSTTSFHPRKVITTGEGGACFTDDPVLADRMRTLRNHGQQSPGQFACASGNYRLTEPAAAVGLAQMAKLDWICERRRALAEAYREALPKLQWQKPARASDPNHQTCGLLVGEPGEGSVERDRVVSALRAEGVSAGILSYCLAALPQFTEETAAAREAGRTLNHAADIAARGLAIPLYPRMTDEQHAEVVSCLRSVI